MTGKYKILLILFVAVFCLNQHLWAQDQAKIDSLENILINATGRDRFNILTELSTELARVDNNRSQEFADEAILLAKQLDDIELIIAGYLNKGYSYELVYKDDEALRVFEEAYQISEEEEYDKGRAESLHKIGRSYSFQKDYKKSDEYFNRALQLSRDVKDMKLEAQILYALADNQRQTGNLDSALAGFINALEIARKAEDIVTMALIYGDIGAIYYALGNFNEAITKYEESKQMRIEQGNILRAAVMDIRIANAYFNLAKYDFAIEHYQEALPVFEKYKYNVGIAAVYNGMAVIYFTQEFYDKALENHFKKLEISREMEDQKEVGNTLNNIGNVYSKIATDSLYILFGSSFLDSVLREESDKYFQLFAQALDYYQQSLQIREQLNDRTGLTKTLNNLGTSYLYSGKIEEAMEYFERGRAISEELNDAPELATALLRLGLIYSYKEQYDRALYYLNQSLKYTLELDIKALTQDAYLNLSDVYARMGNFQRALEYYKLSSAIKDTINRKETLDMISEMQVKYETEAVMKDNQLLTTQSELSQAKVRQQRIAIYFFIFVLLSISTLVVLLVRQNNQKKQANLELAQKNALITEQKKEITDSIQYASRIQSAILPPGDYIDELIPERFIIYMPRDIVSGDYYWITEKNKKIICVAADCTGHGVPGAFMSMLGIAFLNEIVSKQDDMHTDEILNDLRAHVIKSLHQTGKEGESQDGMDIALYILDLENGKLEYSGANNSLFIFRDSEMIELKADKMPIGIHTRATIPFTRHNVDIRHKDMIYTFTDGYPDQFGGPHQKKFMVKNFKNVLSQIHTKSMEEQKVTLEKILHEWMAEADQVDDILVVGIRM